MAGKAKESESMGILAAATFVIIFIVAGVPLWWKTTRVYRVSLPYNDIEELSNLEVTHVVPVVVVLADRKVQQSKLYEALYSRSTDTRREPTNPSFNIRYAWKMRIASEEEEKIIQISKSPRDMDVLLHKASRIEEAGVFQIFVLDSNKKAIEKLIGCHRRGYVPYSEGPSLVPDIISVAKEMIQQDVLKKIYIPPSSYERKKPEKDRMRSLSTTTAFDIIFSLIIPEPQYVDVHWEIQRAIAAYIMPFINKISSVAHIGIKSQVIYMLMLPTETSLRGENGSLYLATDRLPMLINPIESRLGSYTSTNPTLNFITYITPKAQNPLHIVDKRGDILPSNAFLVPQWGGFILKNLDVNFESGPRPKVELDMKEIMEIFLNQLRLLLGLPDVSKSESISTPMLHSPEGCDWELDFLMRKNTQEQLSVAASSLYSLGELLKKICNIVIGDEVGEMIYNSVSNIKKSIGSLEQGFLEEAFVAAKNAFNASESAFFDPSLLSLLYFPEEQKYAVYIPLFLPISIPIFLSLCYLWLYWWRKENKDKDKLE